MKDKIKYIFLIAACASFVLEIYDIISQDFAFSISITVLLLVTQVTSLLIFTYLHTSKVKNVKKFVDIIQIVLCLVYFINLCYELFINPAFRTSTMPYKVNIIPFHTIKLFINSVNTLSLSAIVLNLAGNIILFIPLGYFLYIFFERCRHFLFYLYVTLVVIMGVELIQVYFGIGTGDIDDIILNMTGVIIFFIFTKFPLFKKYLEKMSIDFKK